MQAQLQLADITVSVTWKDIKNVHLSVHPPMGRVTIAAPLRMKIDTIRVFAISKLGWIRQQQQHFRAQERETPREFLNRESHHVFGRRVLLHVVEEDAPPRVEAGHHRLTLYVRPGWDLDQKESLLERFFRDQIRAVMPMLLAKWEPILGVRTEAVFVQRMKTKWGSCNPSARTIRLNTDLAKKPRECLEYIVVHELVHLLEPTHNARFLMLMDRFLPKWQSHRDTLNSLPLRHEDWEY